MNWEDRYLSETIFSTRNKQYAYIINKARQYAWPLIIPSKKEKLYAVNSGNRYRGYPCGGEPR
jgi:hypothetical protein